MRMLSRSLLSVCPCVCDGYGCSYNKCAGHVQQACVFKLSQKWPEFLRLYKKLHVGTLCVASIQLHQKLLGVGGIYTHD